MKTVKLGDVCIKITDGSHNPPKATPHGEFMMLSSRNIQDDEISFDNIRLLSKEDFDQENKRTDVQPGDVLLTIVGTIGRTIVVPENLPKFTLQRSVAVIKPNKELLDPSYLMFHLRSDINFLIDTARGVAQKGIYLNQIKDLKIDLPPLEQQRRIVARLDAAFEKIDRAIELTEKNVANVKDIYNRTLDQVFDTLEIETYMTLGKVYDVRDGTHDSPKYRKEGYPLVTSKNLKTGTLNTDNVQFIAEADYKKINDRSKVSKGDILMAMIGTIGNPIIVDVEPNFAIKNVALFKAPDTQNSSFLKYYLESPKIVSKMINDAKGSTQKFVSLGYLRSLPFPVIGTTEQNATVRHLHDIEQRTQSAYQLYMKKSKRLQNLKQSLLTQAFSQDKVQ